MAVEALARRRRWNLAEEGVSVVAIGGATNIGHSLRRFGPAGLNVHLNGLCDEGEEGDFRRELERARMGTALTRSDMEALGFYVCVADLEDELIRTLGADVVESVIEAEGELSLLRTFQRQPWWLGRHREDQLRRFMGTRAGRKIHYARALVEALDLDRVPRPLDLLLSHTLSR